jgi:hypothetical protein
MTMSLVNPVLLGLDGFAVCLALGPLRLGVPGSISFVGWFGLCDGLALLAGKGFHLSPAFSPALWLMLMGLWAVVVLLLLLSRTRVLLPLLPVLLAFDNLAAGAARTHAGVEDAVLSGAVSAALAVAGLLAGRALTHRIRSRHKRLASGGLLLAVGFMAITG